MENLPKDVLNEMALNLSPPDLINFCSVSKIQNKNVCESETFWRRKLEKDYPEEFLEFYEAGIPIKDPKRRYINRFTFISKNIEDFTHEFIIKIFGLNFEKFLNEEYRKGLFNIIYKLYEENKREKYVNIDVLLENGYIQVNSYGPAHELVSEFINYLISEDRLNETKRRFLSNIKK